MSFIEIQVHLECNEALCSLILDVITPVWLEKTDVIYLVSYVSGVSKGPVKLIKQVKIAHSFHCLFHFIVLAKMTGVMHEADRAYSVWNTW